MKNFILTILIFTFSLTLLANSNICNKEVKDILQKVKNVTDPKDIAKNMKSRVEKAVIEMPKQKFKAYTKVSHLRPDMTMFVTKMPNGKIIKQVVNGNTAWEVNDKDIRKITGKELDYLVFNTKLDSFRSEFMLLFSSIKLEKSEKVGKYQCYVLKCIPRKKFNIETPVIVYIDKNNYLIRKTTMSTFSKAGLLEQNILAEKYEEIGGVVVASVTKTNIMGADIIMKLEELKINPKIDKSEFKIPKELEEK